MTLKKILYSKEDLIGLYLAEDVVNIKTGIIYAEAGDEVSSSLLDVLDQNKINYRKSVSDAIQDSQCVIIMTQWKQYQKLTNNDFKNMKRKIVIDCRRILVEKQLDVDYFAIGIGK